MCAVLLLTPLAAHPLLTVLNDSQQLDLSRLPSTQWLARIAEHGPKVVIVDLTARANAEFALISQLHEYEPTRHTSVLALLDDSAEAVQHAVHAGADDFVRGPAWVEVAVRVERLLRQATISNHFSAALLRARNESPLAFREDRPSIPPLSGNDAREPRESSEERRVRRVQPYAEFFDKSADGAVVMDAQGKILFANAKAREIFSLKDNAPRGNVLDFLVPQEKARAQSLAYSLLSGEFPANADFRVRTGSHEAIVSVNFSAALRNERAVLFTFRDVTRERATERDLKQAREFLESVIDSSVDAIVAAELNGNVRLFNRAACRIFGYESAQVVGKMNVKELYPPGVARDVMNRIRSDEHGGAGRLEGYAVNMQDAAGRPVPVRISAGLIHENGEPSGSVGIFRDVREELRMAARLREAQEAVRHHEKSMAVAQLAGATAHELNQPLTVVLAYAELLSLRLEAESPHQETARIIREQAERMANIVRQVGKITRYETKSYVGSTQILDLEKASQEGPKSPS